MVVYVSSKSRSEHSIEDLLAQIAWRYFGGVGLFNSRDALSALNHVRASVPALITYHRSPRMERTVTKSISWVRQKGVRMYRYQPIQRPKKMGMLMYPVRKFCVFHTKKTW